MFFLISATYMWQSLSMYISESYSDSDDTADACSTNRMLLLKRCLIVEGMISQPIRPSGMWRAPQVFGLDAS